MLTLIIVLFILGILFSILLAVTGAVLKVLYLLIIGLPLALVCAVIGLMLCCTLIGIPLGKLCFKLAGTILMPF